LLLSLLELVIVLLLMILTLLLLIQLIPPVPTLMNLEVHASCAGLQKLILLIISLLLYHCLNHQELGLNLTILENA